MIAAVNFLTQTGVYTPREHAQTDETGLRIAGLQSKQMKDLQKALEAKEDQ
jgi:hypothetical protein